MDKYRTHLLSVFEALSEEGQHRKLKKCEFHRQKVSYLRLIIESHGVTINPVIVSVVEK